LAGLAGLWGAQQRLHDIRPGASTLVTAPDLRAAAWVAANTPPDAGFLVNAFAAYGGSSVVGSDAGWWLPLLAKRRASVPPLTYAMERGPRDQYRDYINELPAAIQAQGIDHPEVLRSLRERGLTYIYVGQRQGAVNNPGAPLLAPAQLLASPHFRPLYHEDRVWVFEMMP
jgi:hypothetical protein